MDGHAIGLTITIIAALALIAGLVWLFVFGPRDRWPDGRRTKSVIGPHEATVIWHPRTDRYTEQLTAQVRVHLTAAAARAALSVGEAWQTVKGSRDAVEKLARVAAYVLSDDEFDRLAAQVLPHLRPQKVSAWLEHVPRKLGSGPPMAIVRFSQIPHMIATGQPFIHEYLHEMGLLHDRKHADQSVWEDRDDDIVQIEELAEKLFVD